MTTGRINQVTILSHGAKRKADPQKEGECYYKAWSAEALQTATLKVLEHQKREQPIQLPPLSFPRGDP